MKKVKKRNYENTPPQRNATNMIKMICLGNRIVTAATRQQPLK